MKFDLSKEFHSLRILVTGGAGFVGSNIVRTLNSFGAKVTVLDNLETSALDLLATAGDYRFIEGDVANLELVLKCVRESDLVIHAAARNIIVSTKNPSADYETNIGGTLNVLLAARESSVRRVVYTSSASVYGNPRYLPVTEDDKPSFLSPYAVSKYSAEGYCQAFHESYDVPVATVRYSNVYGPGQTNNNPYCGVIGKFFQSVIDGRPIQIHGDGLQTRDFTFVEDAVDATLLAAVSPRAIGEVFNVGTGFETSVNDLVERVMIAMGRQVPVEYIDRRDIDNIRRRVMNIEKIRRVLHWTPKYSLIAGLKRTALWLTQNKSAFPKVLASGL